MSRHHPSSAHGQAIRRIGHDLDPSHSVVIRFRSDVRPGDRFVYRGRLLEVVDPTDLNGRRVYLNCTCRAIASAEASHV